MDTPLPKSFEQYIRRKIRAGEYDSSQEVLMTALRLLKDRDAIREARLEAIRREVQVGIDAADAGRVKPIEGLLERVRARVGRATPSQRRKRSA